MNLYHEYRKNAVSKMHKVLPSKTADSKLPRVTCSKNRVKTGKKGRVRQKGRKNTGTSQRDEGNGGTQWGEGGAPTITLSSRTLAGRGSRSLT